MTPTTGGINMVAYELFERTCNAIPLCTTCHALCAHTQTKYHIRSQLIAMLPYPFDVQQKEMTNSCARHGSWLRSKMHPSK